MEAVSTKLFLVSGKIASGKSTLAKKLATQNNALLICQDDWLATLFPEEIRTLEDYVKYFGRLTSVMGRHVADILRAGKSVVLDFPANTLKTRAWMKSIGDSANCKIEIHFLDAPDQICLKRLKSRNGSGEHPYKTSEEEFHQFTRYFVPPDSTEGFEIVLHPSSDL
jgi:predicted kinase